METITERDVVLNDIVTILSAYPEGVVAIALKRYALFQKGMRDHWGWKLHFGTIPENTQWRKLNNKIYIWIPPEKSEGESFRGGVTGNLKDRSGKFKPLTRKEMFARKRERGDMSVKKASILCPLCQSEMFREPICRGCKEGKAGYRVRLICGDNDKHTWIV
jgi:hypothetical protein